MPNLEIEYKYKISDIGEYKHKVEELGAKFLDEKWGVDTYFVVPKNPEGRKYLRIRKNTDFSEFSYSYAISESKTKEWETKIEDAETAKDILFELGYKLDVIVDKTRRTYKYKDSEILLDVVKDLGHFIEIESPNLTELLKIAKELGLSEKVRITSQGYPDLIRGYIISD